MFTVLLILLVSSSLKGLSLELQQDAIFDENQQLQNFDLENEQLVQSGPVVYERDRREVLEEGSGDGGNVETESPPEEDSNNNTTKTNEDKTEATIGDETTPEVPDTPENANETKSKTEENDASNINENSPEPQNEDTTKASVNPLNVPDENADTNEKHSNASDTTTIGDDSELNPNIRRLQPKADPPSNGDKLEEHKDHAEIIDDKNEKKDNETSQMRAGDKDKNETTAQSGAGNNILIILVVVVIVAGAGCFGYKYCKSKQEDSPIGDNPGTELKEIKVDQKTDTKQPPNTSAEMKPLLNQNKTNQNEAKENKGNDAKSGENAINENTPCNGRNNEN